MNARADASALQVSFQAWHNDSINVPVLATLYNAETKVLGSQWIRAGEQAMFKKLSVGRYIVQLKLPSGLVMNKMTDLENEEKKDILFNLHEISPYETSEWAYLLSNDQPFEETAPDRLIAVQLHIWQKYDRDWVKENYTDIPQVIEIDKRGHYMQFRTGVRMGMLEVFGAGQGPKYVCLPPDQEIRIALQINSRPDAEILPVKVTVASISWKAETILALLKTSGTKQARAMLGGEAEELAETMLLEKRANPTEAAIGAYYILKTRDYARLHNWANNLANFFPWMPDGAVIHAWQMISQPGNLQQIDEISGRLREAFGRGLPLYAEGLRLLYEGLMWLVRQDYPLQDDLPAMLNAVRNDIALVDWDHSLTTLNLPLPDPELVAPPPSENIAPASNWESISGFKNVETNQYMSRQA
jgi:hypothetical protein